MITATDIVIKYSKEVIDGASFTIMQGDKIGIVGPNGAGKSTLFKVIMGEIKPSVGKIDVAKNINIGFLPQVIYDDFSVMNSTVYDYLMSARPLKEIETEMNRICEEMEDGVDVERKMNAYIRLQDKFQLLGGYEVEGELMKIVKGLSMMDFDMNRKMRSLSGGEKSKIAFARLIFLEPDIMLLDEPTNHLDKNMWSWVIDFLQKYKKALVVISHDQDFLDAVVNRIYHVSHESLDIYHGNYKRFTEQKKERDETLQRIEKNREKEEKRILDYINKMHNISGRRKRQVKSRMKQLDKLQDKKVDIDNNKGIKLSMDDFADCGKLPLSVEKLEFVYEGCKKPIFTDLNFDVLPEEKFLIVGKNGVGKTTLLKILSGKIGNFMGSLTYNPKVELAYYSQEHEDLCLEYRVIDEIVNVTNWGQGVARNYLGRFLFRQEKVFQLVNTLSPGERSRLALAKIIASPCNFLILDEPTNHLDIQIREVLADVLEESGKTMIIVSHEVGFLERLEIDRMLVLPDGIVDYYNPDIVLERK